MGVSRTGRGTNPLRAGSAPASRTLWLRLDTSFQRGRRGRVTLLDGSGGHNREAEATVDLSLPTSGCLRLSGVSISHAACHVCKARCERRFSSAARRGVKMFDTHLAAASVHADSQPSMRATARRVRRSFLRNETYERDDVRTNRFHASSSPTPAVDACRRAHGITSVTISSPPAHNVTSRQ